MSHRRDCSTMRMKMPMFLEPPDPTNQLLAFEATARHQSVGAAAAELDSTPRDISRSLRELEAAMGTRLFTRCHGTIGLTQAGEVLYLAVSKRLGDIREAPDRLHRVTPGRADRSEVSGGCPLRSGATAPQLPLFLSRYRPHGAGLRRTPEAGRRQRLLRRPVRGWHVA